MLVTPANLPPKGNEWVYEVKFDGYRMMGYVEDGKARLISKGRADYTNRFPTIAAALLEAVGGQNCVVDGELVAIDEKGHPQLSLLQRRQGIPAYYLFDVLEIEEEPVLSKSLLERRELLKELYRPNKVILLSEFFDDAMVLLREMLNRKLEGIVAKRKTSPYRPGTRSPSWKKIKIPYVAKIS